MPRNSAGTYTLPAGNPVVAGTTIDASWANDTMSDMANEITNSLSRTGAGGMLAPFRVADGLVSAPGLGFTNETNSGLYRAGTGELWLTIGGVAVAQITGSGLLIPSGKRIALPAPVNDADAANKEYVDDLVNPVIQYANYYLGPKSSDPSVNNTGGALTEGSTYWSTTLDQMRVYNGTTWEPMPSTASLQGQTFSGTGAQAAFTLAAPTGNATNLEVFISGVRQVPTTDYTVSGTTLTFTSAPPSGTDNIYVRFAQLIALASADSSNVSYLPSGTGAVITTVQAKLRESVSVLDFGADPTGATDSLAAFNAALATIPGGKSGSIYVPAGTYYLSSTLVIDSSVKLYGAGVGIANFEPYFTAGSRLIFPDGVDGVRIKRPGGGDYAIIENLCIRAQGKTIGFANGFTANARFEARFVSVQNFSGNGWNIEANSSAGQNANLWRMEYCDSSSNVANGLYVDGADANAGTCIGFNSTSNGAFAIYDSSFLGNHFYGCHSASDGGAYAADSANAVPTFVGCYSEGDAPWYIPYGKVLGGTNSYKNAVNAFEFGAFINANKTSVSRLSITNNGSGYTSAPTVTIDAPPTPVAATASATVRDGKIVYIKALTGGSGYFANAAVTITDATGTGASAVALIKKPYNTTSGDVYEVIITNQGSGYTNPTITIATPATTQATATAIVNSLTGIVQYIRVTNKGSGYTTAPAVTITGGGGSSAAATAILSTTETSSTTSRAAAGEILSWTATNIRSASTAATFRLQNINDNTGDTVLDVNNGASSRYFTLTGPFTAQTFGRPQPAGYAVDFKYGVWLNGQRNLSYGTSIPVTENCAQGDIVFNVSPTAGGFVGWVCVTSGSAGVNGVWKTFGAISP